MPDRASDPDRGAPAQEDGTGDGAVPGHEGADDGSSDRAPASGGASAPDHDPRAGAPAGDRASDPDRGAPASDQTSAPAPLLGEAQGALWEL